MWLGKHLIGNNFIFQLDSDPKQNKRFLLLKTLDKERGGGELFFLVSALTEKS